MLVTGAGRGIGRATALRLAAAGWDVVAGVRGYRKAIPRSQRMVSPADGVAATIEKALADRRPRARYIVGRSPRVQALVALALPTSARDALLRAVGGVPRRP